jgi:predicted ATP-grasp superfamily ATP-dependent carboligase
MTFAVMAGGAAVRPPVRQLDDTAAGGTAQDTGARAWRECRIATHRAWISGTVQFVTASSEDPTPPGATMVPALILGSAHSNSLEVLRILGRRGIPRFAVGTAGSFVARSRWHRALPGAERADGPASLAALLGRVPLERAVLVPCTDDWVLPVARLEPALAARFPACVASPDSHAVLLDKSRFADAVARLDVPHPRTVRLDSEEDLAALADPALRGAFLKPRDSQAFSRRYGVKAFRFETRAEAARLFRDARAAGLELVLQDYIPGPPTRHYFVDGFIDRTGALRACFVMHRLRMFPPDFGDGSYGVSVPADEARPAVEIVRRFLGDLRYRGLFDAEFKYDERDGLFKLLEINCRPYRYVGFAAACGVDLVTMLYRDALGLPVESVTGYATGRGYFYPYTDLFGGWRAVRGGALTPWAWARSWLDGYQPLFSLTDPVPAAAAALELAGRALDRRRRRPAR